VVGGSLAGLRCAEALRRTGYRGALTIVEASQQFPATDRPPLSKEVLAGADLEQFRLRMRGDLQAELRLGIRALSLDVQARLLETSDDANLEFDRLVIATGARARQLPGIDPRLPNVFTLRAVEDALALRDALDSKPSVVILGAGFIGLEVAAACAQRGLNVSVVDTATLPMADRLGTATASALLTLHEVHGVEFRLGVGLSAVEGAGKVESVLLTDGHRLPADLLMVAVGAQPNDQWLKGSGLTVDDGVVCDQFGAATGARDIVAVGDVANWYYPVFGRSLRIEHWTTAVDQAFIAAQTLQGVSNDGRGHDLVPYFWSHQYDAKVQFVGVPGDDVEVCEGSVEAKAFVAIHRSAGKTVGAVCFNRPGRVPHYRRAVAEQLEV
jgi:NADPH-dependent 2,4-dienoyl-CoA reductase/sulfur reductase-like enzyme